MGYAIILCELILAPLVPSNTARGGGIVMPIAVSVAKTLGSEPHSKTSRSHGGEFLLLCGAHANLITSSMFLTGMAANPLVLSAALLVFPDIQVTYLNWFSGALIPGLLSLALLPLGLGWISSSSIDTSIVQSSVVKELSALGRISRREWEVFVVLASCLIGWATGNLSGIPSTVVALAGITFLLFFETLEWKSDIAMNYKVRIAKQSMVYFRVLPFVSTGFQCSDLI